LPAEFALACACAMWPPSDRRNAAIAAAARAPVDWDRFVRIAHRHRIVGFAHEGLKSAAIAVPPDAARALSEATAQQTRVNLLFAREVIQLARLFERNGLDVVFFKGIPTALGIYGDLAIREAKDIDLLVAPKDMDEADRFLREAQYQRVIPPESVDLTRVHTLMRVGKDFSYRHRATPSVQVELHWRLFKNAVFARSLAASPVETVYRELDGVRLRTIAGDDEFAYLCAHGGAFAWCRLKWLADIAAWLAKVSPEETVRLYRAAVAHGAGRTVAQGYLLCRRLFGTQLPDDFVVELRSDPVVPRLEALAMKAMLQGDGIADPYDLPDGMKPIVDSEWLLRGDLRYFLGELRTRLIGWDDVIDVPLPAGLQFLYPLLRVPLWLSRRLGATKP
jgi:hypothetical protein